jgi:hypothetical protein
MNTKFLITGLILLLVSSLLMTMASFGMPGVMGADGFMNYASTAASVNEDPIGSFDGIRIKVSDESYWRKSSDAAGVVPAFEPGPDNLFFFKNNQCKPECCGASYSCGGGCVCTTPDQRKYINQRGGNNTPGGDTV